MNARNFAALAITASLLAFAPQSVASRRRPARPFRRQLVGQRQDHREERNERAHPLPQQQHRQAANALALSLRCASDSYKFDLASDITTDGANISGSWNETTRGVIGSLSGKISGSNIRPPPHAVGVHRRAVDQNQPATR